MHGPTENNFHDFRGSEALHIMQSGLRCFPAIPGEKPPAVAGWQQKATTDSEVAIRLWSERDYNPCILAGPYTRLINGEEVIHWLTFVDYDMKPGQLGRIAMLEHKWEGWASCVTVATAGGGVHHLYWSDEPIENSVGRIAKNVDVRGIGGYVLAATSIINGVTYVRTGEYKDIPMMPEGLKLLAKGSSKLNGANGANGTLDHNKTPVGELDRPHSIAGAVRYLVYEAPAAITGNHGDQTTFQVAARCKDLGVSEGEAHRLMLAHWNEEKAIPPWGADELRTKVENAYRYGRNPPGSADYMNEFFGGNSGDKGPNGPTGRGIEIYGPNPHKTKGESGSTKEPLKDESFNEAAKNALEVQQNPLVADLIGQGELCAIYGAPGAAKTFVALALSYAVASGTEFNGRKTKQGGVLYVAAEGGPAIRTRFLALRTKHGATDPPLFLLRYPVDFRTGDYDALRLAQLIEQREAELGIKFLMVVIDTLSETLAGGNDTEHMQAFVYNAKLIQQRTGVTVVPVHHPGKDTTKGMRGHTSLVGAVDTAIEVSAPNGITPNARRKMTVRKQRNIDLPAEPEWFVLNKLELGSNRDGHALSSCVVVWADAVEDEFDIGMSDTDKATVAAIRVWAEATGNVLESVESATLLEWLAKNDKTNPIGELNGPALRKRLSRLRQEGFLAVTPVTKRDEEV